MCPSAPEALVHFEEGDFLQAAEWHGLDENPREAACCKNFILARRFAFNGVFARDADEFFSMWRTPRKLCSNSLEIRVPALGLSMEGLYTVIDWQIQLRQCIPDFRIKVQRVTLSPQAAEVEFTAVGTQVQPSLPMFPLGKVTNWRFVSQMAFDTSGLAVSECINVCVDPCAVRNPFALCGLEEWAQVLTFTKEGSQLLEEAIEQTGRPALLANLRGRMVEAAQSPHGNHPLQKYVAAMPPKDLQFIVDEFRGRAVELAQHYTANRVLRRLLQHCPHEQIRPLMLELVEHLHELISHRQGNFVVQEILEHGEAAVVHRIAQLLCSSSNLGSLATHWISSNVVRCALEHASIDDRRKLAQILAPSAKEFTKLSQNRHGSFIARVIRDMYR